VTAAKTEAAVGRTTFNYVGIETAVVAAAADTAASVAATEAGNSGNNGGSGGGSSVDIGSGIDDSR